MLEKLRKLLKQEEGITGLETAIILIAFVVVAAVFAFTVLSAGIFSSDRSKEAVYAGLSQVRGSMEVRGDVIARSPDGAKVGSVIFSVANVAGGEPIDLTEPTAANATCTAGSGCTYSSSSHKVVINYRDKNQYVTDLPWTRTWKGTNDGDNLLEAGEVAEITVPLVISGTDVLTPTLGTDTTFGIEVKPSKGAVLDIERTTPAKIDSVMDLQ